MSERYDAVVVGAGPNGLAAAITMARAGRSVLLVEAADEVGGGCRSAALTLPGFVHDPCSAIHPLAVASPFLRSVPLAELGVELAHPDVPFGQPLDGGRAVLAHRSLAATVAGLGADGRGYDALMAPLLREASALVDEVLYAPRVPRHPLPLARFSVHALRSLKSLVRSRSLGPDAAALLSGVGAHSIQPLDAPLTAGVAMTLGLLAHAVGWPCVVGGSGRLSDALAQHLRDLGGEIRTGWHVRSLAELPPSDVVLLDVAPGAFASLAGEELPARYAARLQRFRHGPGVHKVDYALSGPVPWAAPELAGAGTVHVGGSMAEVADSEARTFRGELVEAPMVLVAQQSAFDATRAPAGAHTLWAYCHVPQGCEVDVTDRIEAQLERFAPGFRDTVIARHVRGPAALAAENPNYVGGDIAGGVQDLRQLFTRPVPRPRLLTPWSTPLDGVWLCSASTPPGGGVHGMSGMRAAEAALRGARRRPARG